MMEARSRAVVEWRFSTVSPFSRVSTWVASNPLGVINQVSPHPNSAALRFITAANASTACRLSSGVYSDGDFSPSCSGRYLRPRCSAMATAASLWDSSIRL